MTQSLIFVRIRINANAMPFTRLNLPPAALTLRQESDKKLVFDLFRKRYVVLTPEEWVRQHFLHWLVNNMGYPKGRIAVETTLQYFRLSKRADAIVYGKAGNPLMIIECKAPEVQITQDVFDQVARYNMPFGVSTLAVTNGLLHYCCKLNKEKESWEFLGSFPVYDQLIQ